MNANELVERLDAAHGKGWHVYRSVTNRWVVAIPRESCPQMNAGVEGDTFEDALVKAAEWRDLPVVPPRPIPCGQITPVKDGSKWRLRTSAGEDRGGNIKTKAEAERCATRQMAYQAAVAESWEQHFGAIVATGVEGVTFRYGGQFNYVPPSPAAHQGGTQ